MAVDLINSGAAVRVPTYDELIWPTLKSLRAMGGSASIDELLAKVIELQGISDEAASFLHTDNRQTKLGYNLAWARTYLKLVGALENSARGIWAITDAGERMSEEDAARVPASVRRLHYGRRRAVTPSSGEVEAASQPPSEGTWKDRVLSVMRAMGPDAFERLAQRLLREAGFTKVEVTGRAGDGGIDGLGVLRVNLLSFQVLFQCKRYSGTVGPGVVRDFRGAMVGRCDKGLIITTGAFSTESKREATRDGAPAIDLIDGDNLCDLLKQLKLGVSTEVVEMVVVDEEWFARV